MSSSLKAVTALLIAVIAVLGGVVAWSLADDGGTTKVARSTVEAQERAAKSAHRELVEAKIRRLSKAKAERQRQRRRAQAAKRKTGIDGSPSSPNETAAGEASGETSRPASSQASSNSFAALESDVSGAVGVAYAPLGSTESQMLGTLQSGHAWSSFKVPISVTLMNEQGGHLTSRQESLAASAITASDNAAAATLFSELESVTGGDASQALERTLSDAGAPTAVATAPPPPGAVSSWGQTDWPLVSSTRFYNALACGAYGGAAATIVGDMEDVIPEQRWGLGQAPFPADTSVAFKGGWGPDGSESGPYLVRQAGIIRSPRGGAVVTIAAQDSSGSFEAGVADLDRVADWVAENIPLDGSC